MEEPVALFVCGGRQCSQGGEHVWDGPELLFKDICHSCLGVDQNPPCGRCNGQAEYVSGSASTCSKCGIDALNFTLMHDDWEPPVQTRLERLAEQNYISTHILHHGLSLCSMSKRHGVPGQWPDGHRWVGLDDKEKATCKACLGRESRMPKDG